MNKLLLAIGVCVSVACPAPAGANGGPGAGGAPVVGQGVALPGISDVPEIQSIHFDGTAVLATMIFGPSEGDAAAGISECKADWTSDLPETYETGVGSGSLLCSTAGAVHVSTSLMGPFGLPALSSNAILGFDCPSISYQRVGNQVVATAITPCTAEIRSTAGWARTEVEVAATCEVLPTSVNPVTSFLAVCALAVVGVAV